MRQNNKHNHPPDEAEMTVSIAVEAMKQKIKESIDPVPTIYQQQLQEVSAGFI